jgi:NDP-sugar pyrophosphorylase family protein
MQAVILAGGKGTRLKPYSTAFPKVLMPIGQWPILEIIVRQLRHYGFLKIVMAVGHMKELIQAYFGDGSKWGVTIVYSAEEFPLGTAAPLRLIPGVEDDFLVMNGDVLTDMDYAEFFDRHRTGASLCTIAMYQKPIRIDLGVIKTDERDAIVDYIEKPVLSYSVSMGVYAFKKETIDHIPPNAYFDFPQLILKLIGEKRAVAGYRFDGLWLDIGRPSDYELAEEEFEKHKSRYLKE